MTSAKRRRPQFIRGVPFGRDLLMRLDDLALRLGVSRSYLVRRGAEMILLAHNERRVAQAARADFIADGP